MIGLLISSYGYTIGYQIFEGNTLETKILLPVLELFQEKFDKTKPKINADAALLSEKTSSLLKKMGTNTSNIPSIKRKG
ncbi:MAG: hypothetical protein ACLFVR_15200 [Thiohalospira sp.]